VAGELQLAHGGRGDLDDFLAGGHLLSRRWKTVAKMGRSVPSFL
jgi:hypothetical protein